jgi:hypothetical protein
MVLAVTVEAENTPSSSREQSVLLCDEVKVRRAFCTRLALTVCANDPQLPSSLLPPHNTTQIPQPTRRSKMDTAEAKKEGLDTREQK